MSSVSAHVLFNLVLSCYSITLYLSYVDDYFAPSLFRRLQNKIPAIREIIVPGQSADDISAQVNLEMKTVQELL